MESGESTYNPEQEKVLHYDAVFVLPSYPFPKERVPEGIEGFVERLAGLPKKFHKSGLLYDTRFRDLATALIVKKGESNKIVTMSRPIRKWMKESYAELMEDNIKQYLGKDEQNVEIIKEKESYDTLSELEKVVEFSKTMGFRHVAIITDSEHGKRVKQLIDTFKENFPSYEIRDMESILTNPKYTESIPHLGKMNEIIGKYHKSIFWKYWVARETLLRKIDPQGQILKTLSKKTR